MKRLWYILDWVDDKILRHNFYWLCNFIAEHYPDEEE